MPDFTTSCYPPIVSEGLAHQMHFFEDYFIHEDAAINTEAVYNACRVEKNRNHEKKKESEIHCISDLSTRREANRIEKKNNRLF